MNLVVGEGLTLRLPEESDGERWLELFRDPDNQRFGVPSVVAIPQTLEDLDGRVAEARRNYTAHEATTFVIAAQDDPGRFLGTVGWSFHVPSALQVADVGYSVHPDSRNRGIASRALRVLTRWLTGDSDDSDGSGGPGGPRLARVQLDHSVENPASCRTALAA